MNVLSVVRELSLVGSLLANPKVAEEVLPLVSPDDFQSASARAAYIAIRRMIEAGDAPDVVAVAAAVGGQDDDLRHLLHARDNATPSLARKHADEVAKAGRLRRLRDFLGEAMAAAEDGADPDALTAKVQAALEAEHRSQPEAAGYTFEQAMGKPLSSPYIVKGVCDPGAITIAFGDSGALKSFVMIDLMAHIAIGKPWRGRRVRGTGVLAVIGEGQGGYSKRLRAWAKGNGVNPADVRLYVHPQSLDLMASGGQLAAAIAEAEKALGCAVGVVLIDTLSTCLGAADEQGNSDLARILANVRKGMGPARAAVLTHHVGHADKTRERGAYVIRANADFRFLIERTGQTVTVTNLKAKDGDELAPMTFGYRVVELGTDEDGDPITSLVVDLSEAVAEQVRRVPMPQGDIQKLAYEAISALLRKSPHFGKAGALPVRPCVPLDDAIAAAVGAMTCPTDRRKFNASRAVSSMAVKGVVNVKDGWLWLP